MRCCRDYWRWRMPFRCRALRRRISIRYFSCCGWIHPEIFWATGYKYRYYPESANLVFLPEYLFEKGKIREHQKAMKARVEKPARAQNFRSEKENTSMTLSAKTCTTIS